MSAQDSAYRHGQRVAQSFYSELDGPPDAYAETFANAAYADLPGLRAAFIRGFLAEHTGAAHDLPDGGDPYDPRD